MLRIGRSPMPIVGAPRVRLVQKMAHCAAQATIVESVVAVAVLATAVWGMVGFLMGGRILVERTGQGVMAVQVAQQQIDQLRASGYSSIALGTTSGTETVGGVLYTWVLTVTSAQADPGDSHSTFKQAGATVTWSQAAGAKAVIDTAFAQ